jgi:hypothetical protein
MQLNLALHRLISFFLYVSSEILFEIATSIIVVDLVSNANQSITPTMLVALDDGP